MYDEERGAAHCVSTVLAALRSLPRATGLIVVDDGSTDGTLAQLQLVEVASHDPQFVLLSHERNRGYGQALRTGAVAAEELGFPYVLFMDSDLTNDPKYLRSFGEKIDQGFDLVKASRYMPDGGTAGVPAWRVLISRAGNWVAAHLFGLGIHDCTNGFRAIRASLFRTMPLTESRFPIIMEELYHAKRMNCAIAEIPTTLTNRTEKQRPSSFPYGPGTFYRYLKYPLKAWRNRRRPTA
jgi:dolichol-phosphate mannosyltransferase